jgi:diguanylate cyclase (GGDEF)-like protein
LLIIRLHNGPLSRKDATEVLLPAGVLSMITSVFALAALLLFEHGLLGAIVVVVLAAVGFMSYQAHAATRRRHQGLTLVHDFVAGGVGAESLEALAAELLARIRILLRASSTELVLLDGAVPGPYQQRSLTPRNARALTVTEDDRLVTSDRVVDPDDWTLIRALSSGEPLLAARTTKDRGVRSWLGERGLRDAVLVPFPASSGLTGTLSVTDRLGETATFTHDDVTLLQTLAGHLAVAVRSTRLVDKLGFDATHDSLTGLLNRAYLSAQIHSILAQPAPSAGVLLLDLNRFKEVNDGLGHEVGDRLLMVVGKRLVECVPPSATVARLGGDEFAILVPNLSDLVDGITELGERIADALAQPVAFEEAMLTPEASIGIAITSPAHPQTELLRQADTAMYHAKTHDRRVAIYTPEMDRGRVERLALLADLRDALVAHPEQFVMHYQPQIDLATQTVTGAEALVRWHHPTLGIVPPDRFIPLAESTGLIEQLTPLVLNAALTECAQWPAGISVAVNLSARNLNEPHLAERVAGSLSATGVSPDRLILEITESSVMGDPAQTLPLLHRLHHLGVCLSLDDFGTGYSSLSYLQRLPVGELKVDRSFVVGLTGDDQESSRAVISTIAGLGRNLGLRVVAEGIEDEATRQALLDLGCNTGQGFYFSRPLPTPEFRCWLDNSLAFGRGGTTNRLRSVG